MKKFTVSLMAAMLTFVLCSCSSPERDEEATQDAGSTEKAETKIQVFARALCSRAFQCRGVYISEANGEDRFKGTFMESENECRAKFVLPLSFASGATCDAIVAEIERCAVMFPQKSCADFRLSLDECYVCR